jgi:hypothetical protein
MAKTAKLRLLDVIEVIASINRFDQQFHCFSAA